jgi:hypothetical protein
MATKFKFEIEVRRANRRTGTNFSAFVNSLKTWQRAFGVTPIY